MTATPQQKMTEIYTKDAELAIVQAHKQQTFFDGNKSEMIAETLPEDEFETEKDIEFISLERLSLFRREKATFLIILLAIVCMAGAVGLMELNKDKKAEQISESRMDAVVKFLFDAEISSLPDLKNVASPQHHAAAFVADGDLYQMDTSSQRFVERYVLALLYYELSGNKWTYQLNFLSDTDHCNWWNTYTTEAGDVVRMGVMCDENGSVKKLNLAYNNLMGNRIPEEIGHLKDLEVLHMYYNHISGYFPEAFRFMKMLKGIGLMQCGLQGTIPSWIGEMTQLTSLGLGDNQFEGEVPESLKTLKNLRLLGLDGNNGLTGNIDRFKSMTQLEALYLENNAFSGSLENLNLPNLSELDVSNNLLDGQLTNELFNHPKLTVLDIHRNLLFGPFPDDILENTQLEIMAMHDNQIQGTIPDRFGFLSGLKHFDISFNLLTGTIPDTLTQLTGLRYWATSSNTFDVHPMPDFSKMTNLQELAMKANSLTGKIPDWIGELSVLQLLDLDANKLSGSIPTWIGLLKNLGYLLLNRNELTGTLPSQLQNLHGLNVLLLDSNSIVGNADGICQSDSVNPSQFVSDCYPGENGQRPEIECRCCSQCCVDSDPSCNDKKWTSNLNPSYEVGYIRQQYSFSLEKAPAMYSKNGANANPSGTVDPIDGI